jgi:hypothetical protein
MSSLHEEVIFTALGIVKLFNRLIQPCKFYLGDELFLLLSLLFRQQVATRAENMEILKTKAITIPFECHNKPP